MEEGGGGHGARRRRAAETTEARWRSWEVGEVLVMLRPRRIDLRGSNAGESIDDDGHDARSFGAT